MSGHPLHPIVVPFPVVLLVGGVLVSVVSAWLFAWRRAALLTGGLVYGLGVGTVAGR